MDTILPVINQLREDSRDTKDKSYQELIKQLDVAHIGSDFIQQSKLPITPYAALESERQVGYNITSDHPAAQPGATDKPETKRDGSGGYR